MYNHTFSVTTYYSVLLHHFRIAIITYLCCHNPSSVLSQYTECEIVYKLSHCYRIIRVYETDSTIIRSNTQVKWGQRATATAAVNLHISLDSVLSHPGSVLGALGETVNQTSTTGNCSIIESYIVHNNRT